MKILLRSLKFGLKCIYYVFPKFIRDQYNESLHYYVSSIKRLFVKNVVMEVELIAEPSKMEKILILDSSSDRHSTMGAPTLYLGKNNFKMLPILSGSQPDLFTLKIQDSMSIGWTMGILSKEFFYHPELANQKFIHDNKRSDIYSFTNTSGEIEDLTLYYKKPQIKLTNAIHLLKEHSPNYFHWLFEIMPRLICAVDYIKRKSLINIEYSILIDKGVPLSCREMIDFYLKKHNLKYKMVFVKRGEGINCKNMLYISPLWYAFDNTKYYPNASKDFLVDRSAVQMVREALCYQNEVVDSNTRKIYLGRREGQMRNIINIDQVDSMMENLGFEVVFTDIMSLDEQMDLFKSAKIVVGAAGAAFSNMIFMQQGANVVMFSPSIKKTNYYIFQQIADVSGVNLVHFLTTPKKGAKTVHDDFYIDCDDLQMFIKNLEVSSDVE